jgi:allantoin racemase
MGAHNRRRILVVNPNCNARVTHGLATTLAPVSFHDGPEIVCETLQAGPYGIETQAHVDEVAMPLMRLVSSRDDIDAFVIACYSDPGLYGCREATQRPVFGINEAGVLTALARGERFGVIAIAQPSIRRHLRYLRQLGLMDRLAGERPLNMSVAEGADVVIMGCAGMARHRAPLEAALGIAVIDPTQAAVAMAIGAVQFA